MKAKAMKLIPLFLSTVLLLLLPSMGYAFDFAWQSPSQDKSLFYLGQIFGTVGNALPGSGNALLGNLFSIFNIAILTLGSIVVSYTIILSTINTAHEGDVMGKKWSSIWIPLRSAIGIAFLLPTASGYSLLQIMMMDIVVYGVAAANQVWGQVVNTMANSNTGVIGTATIKPSDLKVVAQNLFSSMVCAQVVNTNTACQIDVNKAKVAAYTDPTTSEYLIGVEGNPNYASICGGYSAGTKPQNVDPTSWTAANLSGFGYATGNLAPLAGQVVSGATPTGQSVIYNTMSTLQGNITQVLPTQTQPITGQLGDAKQNGWIFAGSYYFVMIKNNRNNPTYAAPSILPMTGTATGSPLGPACQSAISSIAGLGAGTNLTNYLAVTDPMGQGTGSSTSLTLPKINIASGSAGQAQAILDAIMQPLQDGMTALMLSLTTNDPAGPIPSLAYVGMVIMEVAVAIWVALIWASFGALLAGCIVSGVLPVCWAIGAAITTLVPAIMIIIGLFWGAGVLLGIYVPLIPYLVFTFTALGWMLLVIETIVAAPIVALGLVSPAGEHLGKASPAVMLIVNVFLRPSLMVIGLMAAVYLVNAVVSMLNFGFFATLESAVHGLGLFGYIAVVILYTTIVISLIQECFSLIHILPDKIVRWIGGQTDSSHVKEQLRESKQATEKGGEIGGGMMKGSAAAMSDQAKDFMKSAKEKDSGKKGGGGGGLQVGGGPGGGGPGGGGPGGGGPGQGGPGVGGPGQGGPGQGGPGGGGPGGGPAGGPAGGPPGRPGRPPPGRPPPP